MASAELNIKKWQFRKSPEEITFKFTGSSSPDLYGIALDANKGVAVDNIAMRGSAGLVFTRINQDLLHKMIDTLNVKLLILQFGGNVVPYIADKHNYYKKRFYRQLCMLKQVHPSVPIIVIGVSDMSVKEKDNYVTYPNLENIRNALRNATFEAGCVYWDMYEAMGGYNSMPSWVYAQPALATSDFVHFNVRGSRVIAEMFYNALIFDFERYLDSEKKNIALQ
jgi:hypothetical protein